MDNGADSYRRFLEGDDKGLSEIVELYKDGLILYLVGYVNNIYVAEDLTEDTFFRLITKKPSFSGKCTFKSWLYAIGRNVAVDYIRHESKCISTPLEIIENAASEEYDLECAYIKEEGRMKVHRAMRELSADYKSVLWLVYFEGFSNTEAARIMRKSERQIRNLLYRAKQSLKTKLEMEGFTREKL